MNAPESPLPVWLRWARELQAMSQTGLTYARDPYDIKRYERLREIAAEITAMHSDLPLARVRELFGREAGHATPKVDVRTAAFREGAVLLVRERRDGLWTLPGGWADAGESPSVAAAREVVEESGYEVHITRLVALYDRDRHTHPPLAYPVYKVFFEAEITGGRATTGDETDAVGFFGPDEVPELSRGRVTPWQLRRLFERHLRPELPPDFD
jgi:ADP-ribose pyrophosphatase YjhB (NUDIX family)